jgi:hypothetical protein
MKRRNKKAERGSPGKRESSCACDVQLRAAVQVPSGKANERRRGK